MTWDVRNVQRFHCGIFMRRCLLRSRFVDFEVHDIKVKISMIFAGHGFSRAIKVAESARLYRLRKNSLFCHSERSEESLFHFTHEKKERFLASLGMTKGVGPFFRGLL